MSTAPWEQDHYSYSGPGVSISCEVEFDRETGKYVATNELGQTYRAGNRHAAALGCFLQWMNPPHQEDDDV